MAPTTLAEAKNNAQQDYDPAVIDEFRKESTILDTLQFDQAVNPSGGGATLEYGYRRLKTQPTAATRALNTDYTPSNVTTEKHSVELAVMGGKFEVDRVIATVGPALSGAVALNLRQKVKATATKFQDEVINGDTSVDENGFDGLNVALVNTDTEFRASTVTDWSSLTGANNNDSSMTALDDVDEFLGLLDGTPTVLVGNKKALAKIRSIVRRSGMYTRNPVDGLVGANGRPINREDYGGIVFADAGEKAGTSSLIIPIETRNTKWAITSGGSTAGSFRLRVNGQTTDPIAVTVTTGAVADSTAALEALSSVGTGGVVVSGANKTLTFTRAVKVEIVDVVDATDLSIATDGGTGNTGLTDIYAYRVGIDGFHGVSTVGGQLVNTWLPRFDLPGAVQEGAVELGPVAVALKATKAAAVFRNIKVQ